MSDCPSVGDVPMCEVCFHQGSRFLLSPLLVAGMPVRVPFSICDIRYVKLSSWRLTAVRGMSWWTRKKITRVLDGCKERKGCCGNAVEHADEVVKNFCYVFHEDPQFVMIHKCCIFLLIIMTLETSNCYPGDLLGAGHV
jgi:hypothetical protein